MSRILLLPALLFCVSLGTGCGVGLGQYEQLRSEVGISRAQVGAAKSAVDGMAILKKRGAEGDGTTLFLSKQAVLRTMTKYGSYPFRGQELSQYLRGQFTFAKPSNLQWLSRNRGRFQIKFWGRGVQSTIKPGMLVSAAELKRIKETVTAGGTVTVDFQVWNSKKNAIRIYSRCSDVQLKRNNTQKYRNQLAGFLNNKILNEVKSIRLPASFKGKRIAVTTTPTHLIILTR